MKKAIWTFVLLMAVLAAAAQRSLMVATDGSGDYPTIQAAVDAVGEGQQAVIHVKAGVYDELVKVGSRQHPSTKRIVLIGEGADKTVITSANGKKPLARGADVRDYATLAVYADDFYAQDLCIRNTGGKAAGQALALFVGGDRQTFYRCRVAGYQDTHRTKKDTRSYFRECTIEGATDYIYAGGTCWFERCTLHCLGSGWITAPEDINTYVTAADGSRLWLGFIFNRCTVTRADGVAPHSVALGRCWGEAQCGSLFLHCQLGDVVKPSGWDTMGGHDGRRSSFAEYKSMEGAGPADVSQRIAWSRQLSDADYALVSSYDKVDAAFRALKPAALPYQPEAVIAACQLTAAYAPAARQTLAFPSAEGFGKYTTGGRGCKVVEVTTLADSGEGSLRWALTEAGRENSTIVFRVSGIIDIGPNPQRKHERSIRAKLKNVTIAGQTAPGEGILLRGGKLNLGGSENVIIRNIRSRLGTLGDPAKTKKENFIEGGAIGVENARNIIIDHCCFGWSGEENVTMYDNHFTTVQWCIVHEGLFDAGHHKGVRGYGAQWGGSPATFHHNLLCSNDSRSARINGATNPAVDKNVFLEYQNNVNFNWGRRNSCYGGENEAGEGSSHECNFVGNYYKPGPAHPEDNVFIELSQARKGKQLTGPSLWHFADNVMEGVDVSNTWQLVSNRTGFAVEAMNSQRLLSHPSYEPYLTPAEPAREAYQQVLRRAGTIRRDVVERRLVDDVRSGQPRYRGQSAQKQGIIDAPSDAEGWPAYAPATAPADSDHDGMPDQWERDNGFDPSDPSDGPRVVASEGYTALEVYLNSLMGEHIQIQH